MDLIAGFILNKLEWTLSMVNCNISNEMISDLLCRIEKREQLHGSQKIVMSPNQIPTELMLKTMESSINLKLQIVGESGVLV